MLTSATSVEYEPEPIGPSGLPCKGGPGRKSPWRSVERHRAGAILATAPQGLQPAVVLSGWATEMAVLPDGRRQIFSLAVPGDQIELPAAASPARSLVALTQLELGRRRAAEDSSAAAIDARRQAALERQMRQMLRLGRLTPKERILHLFLELYDRLEPVGLAKNDTFRLPLTQDFVADLLGLSVMHIYRTLQELKREGLATFKLGAVTLLQTSRLPALACYEPPARVAAG